MQRVRGPHDDVFIRHQREPGRDDAFNRLLRAQGALLKRKDLKPGDVLLSGGRSLRSRSIAIATSDPFSHAALWAIGDGSGDDPGVVLMEADGHGVGHTFPRFVLLGLRDGTQVSAYAFAGVTRCAVMRHGDAAELGAAAHREARRALEESALHHPYSKLSRFQAIADRQYPGMKGLTEGVWRSLAKREVGREEGVFCSELVERYFRALGLPLFSDARQIGQSSPNDFYRSPSLLHEQTGFLLADQRREIVEISIAADHPRLGRDKTVASFVRTRKVAVDVQEAARTLQSAFDVALAVSDLQAAESQQSLVRSYALPACLAVAQGDPRTADRIKDLVMLMGATWAIQSHIRSSGLKEVDPVKSRELQDASIRNSVLQYSTMLKLDRLGTRFQLKAGLRRNVPDASTGESSQRRAILMGWLARRASLRQDREGLYASLLGADQAEFSVDYDQLYRGAMSSEVLDQLDAQWREALLNAVSSAMGSTPRPATKDPSEGDRAGNHLHAPES